MTETNKKKGSCNKRPFDVINEKIKLKDFFEIELKLS